MTPEDILRNNERQHAQDRHPLTCPNRYDGDHRSTGSDIGILVSTTRGWICPFCSYTQGAPETSAEALFPRADRFVFGRITVERRGEDVWAVLDGETCLGRGRDRAFESSPSARDEAFLARFRFPLKDAVAIATIASQKP